VFGAAGVGAEAETDGRKIVISEIPAETFPIKKRINTELFINGKVMLYLHKMRERSDQEISDLLEEGRILTGNKCGSESNGSLFR